MRKKRLTYTQRQWLIDLSEGRDPWDKIHGRSAHGGARCTQASLVRADLIIWDDTVDSFVVSPSGKVVAEEEKRRRKK